jgi:hypothetical protein
MNINKTWHWVCDWNNLALNIVTHCFATASKHLPLLLHDNYRKPTASRLVAKQLRNIHVSTIMEEVFYVVRAAAL